jgi:hypothetical protein
MATIRQSLFITRQLNTVSSGEAGNVISNDYFYDLPTAQNVTGDIIDIGTLPAYMTVSDAVLIVDDIDSGAGVVLDVGIMSGEPGSTDTARTCGAEIFSGATTGQAGGTARPTLASAFKILPTEADRSIGVKIATQSATAVAGRIRLRVFMHAADHKTQF